MAIRYVDIEPEDGKAKAAKAPPKPAPVAPPADGAQPADEAPVPVAKTKRRKR